MNKKQKRQTNNKALAKLAAQTVQIDTQPEQNTAPAQPHSHQLTADSPKKHLLAFADLVGVELEKSDTRASIIEKCQGLSLSIA